MALDTYDNLKSSISNWLSRDDIVLEIPDFIRISESLINKKLSLTEYEASYSITSIIGDNTYPLPIDFKTIRDIWVEGNNNWPLSYRTPTQFRIEQGVGQGNPAIYTIIKNNFVIGPSPNSDYLIHIDYIAMLTPLSATVQSNFLTQTSPETIFYGAMMEAAGFIMDVELEVKYSGKFKASLDLLEVMVEEMRFAGTPLEIRSA